MDKLTILIFLFSLLGCKPKLDTVSQTESLDKFAGLNSRVRNVCKYSSNLSSNPSKWKKQVDWPGFPSEEQEAQFYDVLRAVPEAIYTAFFALGGRVKIVPNVGQFCSQNQHASEIPVACWHCNGQACLSSPEAVPVIYISSDPRDIAHALVREFGYVMSEFLIQFTIEPKNAELLGDFSDADIANYELLIRPRPRPSPQENAFLVEMGKTFVCEANQANFRSGQNRYDLSRYLNPGTNNFTHVFSRYVFAEAFDSFYCNKETKRFFKKEFNGTYEKFDRFFHQMFSGSRWNKMVEGRKRQFSSVDYSGVPDPNFQFDVDSSKLRGSECETKMARGGPIGKGVADPNGKGFQPGPSGTDDSKFERPDERFGGEIPQYGYGDRRPTTYREETGSTWGSGFFNGVGRAFSAIGKVAAPIATGALHGYVNFTQQRMMQQQQAGWPRGGGAVYGPPQGGYGKLGNPWDPNKVTEPFPNEAEKLQREQQLKDELAAMQRQLAQAQANEAAARAAQSTYQQQAPFQAANSGSNDPSKTKTKKAPAPKRSTCGVVVPNQSPGSVAWLLALGLLAPMVALLRRRVVA